MIYRYGDFVSDTFGAVYVSGMQNGLPGGGVQGIGPFAIPCSGVQNTRDIPVNTTATVGVPVGAQGVVLVPPATGTVAWQFRTVNGDTGTFLSRSLPSVITFDPGSEPGNVYLNSASSVVITCQFF